MQEKPAHINLPDIEKSRLPLGYRKMCLRRIPAQSIKNKLLIYNEKYKFHGAPLVWSNKPISKILKFK
jgi:hypothetical protein